MVANGDSAKSLWLTEVGWSTSTGAYGVCEAAQADFLTKAFDKVRSSYPYVQTAFWYSFRKDAPTTTTTVAPKRLSKWWLIRG